MIYALAEFNSDVYGFSERPGHPLVVTLKGLRQPADIFVDAARHVYVSDGGTVVEFSALGKPLQTFSDAGHNADGIALCPNGTLFVANSEGDTISVYAGGSTQPTGTIVDAGTQVFHLACDSKSDLFATIGGKPGQVDEFPAQGSGPVNLPIHVFFPEGIAIDRADDVVVANRASIDFYRVGDSKPFKKIRVDGAALDVAFEANDRRIWATTDNGLDRFSVSTGSRIDSISGTFGFIAASPRD
ncbi:MAG: hypothetical protein JO043_08240 [Candidatus Eremiobacteraeota bacterium]|nr:hypothetical protein [Candidatus Eremiobacteraeota bacterium]